ncbi:MAG: hypothetical protein EON56_03865 [Alphaproteobacteria bacterium]|nr:MAG: hypothetical protein EON56_03865 [Alphaproteobacteria bacterium]
MNPNVDIQRIAERYFNYSVRLGDGAVCYARQGLRSMAECLHDAATAFGQSFRDVEISYEGYPLGCYSVPTLEHDTLLLADKLNARLALRCAV